MLAKLFAPLHDARTLMLGIAGAVALWGVSDHPHPGVLVRGVHTDLVSLPYIDAGPAESGHDTATCQGCRLSRLERDGDRP